MVPGGQTLRDLGHQLGTSLGCDPGFMEVVVEQQVVVLRIPRALARPGLPQ